MPRLNPNNPRLAMGCPSRNGLVFICYLSSWSLFSSIFLNSWSFVTLAGMYHVHTGSKTNFLSRNSCLRNVNFVKYEILKMWFLWKMRLWKCEFCQKCKFENVKFWINQDFCPSVIRKRMKIHTILWWRISLGLTRRLLNPRNCAWIQIISIITSVGHEPSFWL